MILKLHRAAAFLSLLLIAGFWLASAAAELSQSEPAITFVKTAVFIGVFLLVPAMAATGLTGRRLAGRRSGGIIAAKQKRISVMAGLGGAVLIPAAIYLWWKASAGEFDSWFYAVQALEFVAGATNLILGVRNVLAGQLLRRERLAR
jgi:hypothetical protein